MRPKDKIIIITGTFDPLSLEELNFIKKCHQRGDWLIVGVHSDMHVYMTTQTIYTGWDERAEILQNINCVDDGRICTG